MSESKTQFAEQWDSKARASQGFFKEHIKANRLVMKLNAWNPLTSYRDQFQFTRSRKDNDLLHLRKLLGTVTHKEVWQANRALGFEVFLWKSHREPALILGWNPLPIALFGAIGVTGQFFGHFYMKYNMLWMVFTMIPVQLYIGLNYFKQPQQHLENAYSFILAKRAASSRLYQFKDEMDAVFKEFPSEHEKLASYLKSKDSNLYKLEAEALNAMDKGLFL